MHGSSDLAAGEVARNPVYQVRGEESCFMLPAPRDGKHLALVLGSLRRGSGTSVIRIEASRALEAASVSDESLTIPATGIVPNPVRAARTDLTHHPSFATGKVAPPVERVFHLLRSSGKAARQDDHIAIPARRVGLGRRVSVYVDLEDRHRIDAGTVDDIVSTYDRAIEPILSHALGPVRDIDGDGRLAVFITSRLDRLADTTEPLDGCVRGTDFVRNLSEPWSNRCDLVYLNARLQAGPRLRTVLGHEVAHAIVFCNKSLDGRGELVGREEESWLDEGIAHLAEDLLGYSRSNIDHRVAEFREAPGKYRLVVDDYYAAGLFRSHGHRGATYSFLKWCVDTNGEAVLRDLAAGPLRGVESLEQAMGAPFDELFWAWATSEARQLMIQTRADRSSRLRIDLGQSDRAQIELELAGTAFQPVEITGPVTGAVQVVIAAPRDAEVGLTFVWQELDPVREAPAWTRKNPASTHPQSSRGDRKPPGQMAGDRGERDFAR
jgi:hypothetical protein